ncbi:MAG: PDZ domain-containing protein [Corynebacterium sp.]|nr:PDZ domain-containing protein [Corynebacterium sp.]
MNRRFATLAFGAIPVVALAALVNLDHIPGTDIALTVPYAAEGPGPMFNTLDKVDGLDVVEIQGADVDPTSGHLNMTTVSVRTNMTLVQATSRWLFTSDNLVPIDQIIPQDKTAEEVDQLNQQAFLSSESSATTAALRYLKKPLKVEVANVVPDSPANGVLTEGDSIIAINGETVDSGGNAQEIVRSKKAGEEITLTISHRDNPDETEEKTVTLAKHPSDDSLPFLGIGMTTVPAGDIKVKYNLEDVGGPSAGMMFALAVVDKLSPGELNHGKYVVGTGTIDDNGEVGHIGGIEHKARAAADAGADLFLAPKDNCVNLRGKDFGDMKIVSVGTLEDAITQMDNYANGKDLNLCN